MLSWAVVFLIFGLAAAGFAYGGLPSYPASIAKIVAMILLLISVITLAVGLF